MKTINYEISKITGRGLISGWIDSSVKLPREGEIVLIRRTGEEHFTVGKIYSPSSGPWGNAWNCVDVVLSMENTEWTYITI